MQSGCHYTIFNKISPRSESIISTAAVHNPTKLHEKIFMFIFTDKQTIDEQCGGNKQLTAIGIQSIVSFKLYIMCTPNKLVSENINYF